MVLCRWTSWHECTSPSHLYYYVFQERERYHVEGLFLALRAVDNHLLVFCVRQRVVAARLVGFSQNEFSKWLTKYDTHKKAMVALQSVYLCISISYIVYSWAFGWGVAICEFACIRCCYVFISLGLLWKNVWEAQVVTWLQLSWRVTTFLFHQITILPWVPIIYRMSLFQQPFWAKHNRLLQT